MGQLGQSVIGVTSVNLIILGCCPHLIVEEMQILTHNNFDMTHRIISSALKDVWALILKMYSSLLKCHSNSSCKYIGIFIIMTITTTVVILPELASILSTVLTIVTNLHIMKIFVNLNIYL